MAQDIAHESRKFFFTGVSGTGKSTAALELIRGYPFVWLFIFDHDAEYAQRLGCFTCRTEAELLACIQQRKAVVFDPSKMFPGTKFCEEKGKEIPWGQSEAFRYFCDLVWECRTFTGTKLFFFDEPGIYLPANSARFESHPVRRIFETGRRFKIDTVFAAQRPSDVHNAIRNQATDVFCFRQGDPTSADWLVQKGFDWDEVNKLENGRFVYRDKFGALKREQIELGA